MFKIGEFARIALVPTSQLRYYDEIGLFKPAHIDPQTGYRFYRADQLSDLNRILALRDLGLGLEQIIQLVQDQVSTEELEGMLRLRQAEIHQQLVEERYRLARVEAQLKLVRQGQDLLQHYPVVLKAVPAQWFLSVRQPPGDFDQIMTEIGHAIHEASPKGLQYWMGIFHPSAFQDHVSDWELGMTIAENSSLQIALDGGRVLRVRELETVPQMATVVMSGPFSELRLAYGTIAQWMELNSYQFAGPAREVYLRLVNPLRDEGNPVIEVQIPVTTTPDHTNQKVSF